METAADPERLTAALPTDTPSGWQRSDAGGGIVEYRLPGDDGICAVAKVTVRPDVLGSGAVRVDRKKGCETVGGTVYDDIRTAAEAVESTLHRALE